MLPLKKSLSCAENQSGQSSRPVKRMDSDGMVKDLAADVDINEQDRPSLSMSLEMLDNEGIILMDTPVDEMEVSGNNSPSTSTAPGGSFKYVGVKPLQAPLNLKYISSQCAPRRSSDSMDIYLLQRQGYSSDDEAQYRQFMYKQWKNKQKTLIAELKDRSTQPTSTTGGADKETTNLAQARGMEVSKQDSDTNTRDGDDKPTSSGVRKFPGLERVLLNHGSVANGKEKTSDSNARSNRDGTDNRAQTLLSSEPFVWRQARQDGSDEAMIHDRRLIRLNDSKDDVIECPPASDGARTRNKNAFSKTDTSTQDSFERLVTVGNNCFRNHKPNSSISPNIGSLNVTTTSNMTSSSSRVEKTARNKAAKVKGMKPKRDTGTQGETRETNNRATAGAEPITVVRRHNDTSTTNDVTCTDTTRTFDLSDDPSIASSVSMTSSMASDIINREMENLDLLSGSSSSAESTLSDVLRALDMRTVIANAKKFGRRHLTNGDFDKWLDVGRKLTFLQQSDDSASIPTTTNPCSTSCSWIPTTIQSASASALQPGRVGNRAKRACAGVDEVSAKKRSKCASTTCEVDSLPYSRGYSDWSTSRLLAASRLVSQSDTSVSSSVWSGS